jgi:hypothetical protein
LSNPALSLNDFHFMKNKNASDMPRILNPGAMNIEALELFIDLKADG